MFSHIGDIFVNRPRYAEEADTRQAIRRHDPDYERRRRKKESGQPYLSEDEDTAIVSVESLSLFLDNFLKTKPAQTPQNDRRRTASRERPPPAIQREMALDEPDKCRSGAAAYAAHAYEAMAHHNSFENSGGRVLREPSALTLDADDIRTIHKLIGDLHSLPEHIKYLRIERAGSFLQSLVSAVEKAKAAPKG